MSVMPNNYSSLLTKVTNYLKQNKTTIPLILLGNFLLAVAVSSLIIANGFISGGATGLSLVVHHHLGGDLPAIVFIVNLMIFIIGFFFLGKHFALTTLISAVSYPFFLKICQQLDLASLINLPLLVEATCAAIMIGCSVILIVRQGASTGGIDVFALILNKYTSLTITLTMNSLDALILCGQMSFSTLNQISFGLYIVLITAITMKILESMTTGELSTQKSMVSS